MVSQVRQALAAFHIPEEISIQEKGTHFEFELASPVDIANSLYNVTFPKVVKGNFKNGEMVFDQGFEPSTEEGLKVKKISLFDKEIVFHTSAWVQSSQKVDRAVFSRSFMVDPNDIRDQFFDDMLKYLGSDLAVSLNPFFTDRLEHYKCIKSPDGVLCNIELKNGTTMTLNSQARITIPKLIKGHFMESSLEFMGDKSLTLSVLGVDLKIKQLSVIQKNGLGFVKIRTNSIIPGFSELEFPLDEFTAAVIRVAAAPRQSTDNPLS